MHMNNNDRDAELIRQIARIGKANRRNKLTIQRARAKDAYTKATLEGFQHTHRFPTRYKYG